MNILVLPLSDHYVSIKIVIFMAQLQLHQKLNGEILIF